MYQLVRALYGLLNEEQRRRFNTLQILVVITALFELVGVASVAPFMALIGDTSVLDEQGFIANIYQESGIESKESFAFVLGLLVLVLLSLSALFSIFTTWRLALFATHTGTEIADSLYRHYMRKDWLFHASGSSAQLTKKIANETQRVTHVILMPIMQINAKLVLVIFLISAIFLYNPVVALVGLFVFTISYIMLFQFVRRRLQVNGALISNMLANRYRLMNEGFGGIKDVLLLGRDKDFIEKFSETGKFYARSQGVNTALAQAPRYFIELIAFGAIIALVLYLSKFHKGDLGTILPILSVYALAGFKLLPAFQQIYAGVAQIKGNMSAFESIRHDLLESMSISTVDSKDVSRKMAFEDSIQLEKVYFKYPGKDASALEDINLKISVNTVVGFVGPSGSGKSTLIDTLLGLVDPASGSLIVDGEIISKNNRRAWQNIIGFVPQSIFLSEGTVAENVAFGLSEQDIDLQQLNAALKLAHLEGFVAELPCGIHTKVGERGVQLSGGQRQRIGIARALYHDPEVLVFDEATSALDGVTEKTIMDAIHDFTGKKTIFLVAHRLKTVEKCDQIFYVDQGKVVDQGTYHELISRNHMFKEMADHA